MLINGNFIAAGVVASAVARGQVLSVMFTSGAVKDFRFSSTIQAYAAVEELEGELESLVNRGVLKYTTGSR